MLAIAAPAVQAGENPLYQPAPAWAAPAPFDAAKISADTPAITILDMQQRIEGGMLFSYVDAATRISSPEMLSQSSTLLVSWAPDKGDLIIHELAIVRNGQRIDLLAKGLKLTVLRREQSLEQRELTGILTATTAVEGLQVGDVLRLRATTSMKDGALDGRVQSAVPIITAPARVGFARMQFSWPTRIAPKWRVSGEGVSAQPVRKGEFSELTINLPAPKQSEKPADSPLRFRKPPMVEISTFADWADVSKVMAPLYDTTGKIAPGSALAGEVAAIVKAEATSRARAARALRMVQDQIRYLAVGMNGGNYMPQEPGKTWEVRYGDCKAKTFLLLAMLHEMGIEAEPVLANVGASGLVRDLLPSAGAFNHVFVRATIDGASLWLEGTGSGSRLADLDDTPPLGPVLPLRAAGAELLDIATHVNARPLYELTIDADETASSDVPSAFMATAVIRGAMAAPLMIARAQVGAKEQRDMVGAFFQGMIGEAQFANGTLTANSEAGTVTLTARGVLTTPWFTDERKRKRNLTRAFDSLEFSPDRARAAWQNIPVLLPDPEGLVYKLRVRLPDGGRGYVIEGTPDLKARLGGYDIARTVRLAEGFVTVDERMDAGGGEMPASEIAQERDRLATAKAQAPRLIEPADARRRWDVPGADPKGATQIAAVNAVFGQAIIDNPEEISGFTSRASFRAGIGDRRGAVADLTRAIAIAPSVELYLQRSGQNYELGNLEASLTDAEAARALDPGSSEAIEQISEIKANRGDLTGAIALLDERIAIGGDTRAKYLETKAELIGVYGEPAEAIFIFDKLIAEKPGSPTLLNARCWTKATRAVMLDTALKDCTSAIELSSNTFPALDSRAMVWFRLERYEDALRDLDAVIAAAPGLAQSRFLRSVILKRLNRNDEAAKELEIARRIAPSVIKANARWGIVA